MKQLFLSFLIALSPMAASAQVARPPQSALSELVGWTQGLRLAAAPAERALQSMRQIVGMLQTADTPEGRGAALIAVGPQIADALLQVRQAKAAVAAFAPLVSGDAEINAQAAAAHQALSGNIENLEQALSGIEQMHLAAVRRDVAAVRRAATSLLPFPPAWLRSTAVSFRLVALQSRADPAAYHFLQARAGFYDAGAIVIDLSRPIDRDAFGVLIVEARASLAHGRVMLAADEGLALAPGLSETQRSVMTELLQVQRRGYDVTELALTTLDDAVSALRAEATPEERLAAVRPAALIERENSALSERASEIAAQLVR